MSQQATVESAIPSFAAYACVGDNIEWERAGFIFNARLEYDNHTNPADFWTLDSDEIEDRRLYDAWLNDEWYYIGIVISVSAVIGKGDEVCLDQYAAGIRGIEYHHSAEGANLNQLVKTLEPKALTRAETVCKALMQMSQYKQPEPSSVFSRWMARLKQSLN